MRFVLVHGSWQDSRCWNGVCDWLQSDGHETHTLTLPGNGERANPRVTMAETAGAVVDLIEGHELRDVVLVGHSFGGAVVQLAALKVAERLKRLRPDLKILLTSGYTQQTIIRRQVVDAGMAFLPKPYTTDGFLAAVRAASVH